VPDEALSFQHLLRDHATVFAVMHTRRKPGYWKDRLGG
jgi:hypothetical protein